VGLISSIPAARELDRAAKRGEVQTPLAGVDAVGRPIPALAKTGAFGWIGRGFGRALGLWHLTSLDAATVAVTWTLAFAWAMRVRLPLWVPAILGLGAWSVYVGDRLLDARGGRGQLRDRHRFHWRHRNVLAPLAVLAASIGVGLALRFMPLMALVRTGTLSAAAGVYFGGVHSRWQAPATVQRLLPKELVVGLLFTLACAGPAIGRMSSAQLRVSGGFLIPAVVAGFILLAWLNCHAIESWERARDRLACCCLPAWRLAGAKPGRTTWLGAALAKGCLMFAVLLLALGFARPAALMFCCAVSAGLLAALDRWGGKLSPLTLRAAADLVLLAPLLVLAAAQ
jgi:hypothetical protein